MQVCHGKSVFGGIAIGKLWVFAKKEHQIVRVKVQNPEEELARFEKAKEEAVKQLQRLYDKACKEVGEANAAIFEIHQMMRTIQILFTISLLHSRLMQNMQLVLPLIILPICSLQWMMSI